MTLQYPPFAQPGERPRRTMVVPETAAETAAEAATDAPAADDVPPIERFLDDLPSIDDYLARDPDFASGLEQDAEGWAVESWQSYDWSGLASLGLPPEDRAEGDANWDATNWTRDGVKRDREVAAFGGAVSLTASDGPSADEVAAALDGIARRIRSGELSIDQFRGTPPEAAMAAALAVLLRLRD